jgi:hypothetical protein
VTSHLPSGCSNHRRLRASAIVSQTWTLFVPYFFEPSFAIIESSSALEAAEFQPWIKAATFEEPAVTTECVQIVYGVHLAPNHVDRRRCVHLSFCKPAGWYCKRVLWLPYRYTQCRWDDKNGSNLTALSVSQGTGLYNVLMISLRQIAEHIYSTQPAFRS